MVSALFGPSVNWLTFQLLTFINLGQLQRLVPQFYAIDTPVTKQMFGVTSSDFSTMLELPRDGAVIALMLSITAARVLGLGGI